MLSTALQVLAFALALLGALGGAVATLLPNWAVSAESWSGSVSPVQQMQGLWLDCVWFSSGVFSCAAKTSALSLPAHLQAARAATVLSCLVAALGLCLAALGLKCTRWGGGRRAKGHTAVAAGGCFVLAGLLGLASASWFASEVVGAFLASELPASSKYQPGGALCVTFISAGFLLAGGVIFCMSCPGGDPRSSTGGGGRCCCAHQGPGPHVEQMELRQNKSVLPQADQDCKCDRDQNQDPDQARDRDQKRNCDCHRDQDRNQHRNQDQKRGCSCDWTQNQDRGCECTCDREQAWDRDQDQRFHSSPSKPRPKDIKDSYVLQEYV